MSWLEKAVDLIMTNWAWTQITFIWDWISMFEFAGRWECIFFLRTAMCNAWHSELLLCCRYGKILFFQWAPFCFQSSSKFRSFLERGKVTLNLMPRSSFWLLKSTVGNFCSRTCNRTSKDIFHHIFCRYYTSHFVWRCIFYCQICHKIGLLFVLLADCIFSDLPYYGLFQQIWWFHWLLFLVFLFCTFLDFCRIFSII